jgi:hypothetical protein
MLFGVSSRLSMQHRFASVFGEAHYIENANICYIVLAISFAFEINALRIAYKLFKSTIEASGEKVSYRTLVTEFREEDPPSLL